MEDKISVLVISKKEPVEEFFKSIEDNKEYIGEVIFSGKKCDNVTVDLSIPVKFLDVEVTNKAIIRNRLIKTASFKFALFLEENCILEEDTLEEILTSLEEAPDADIVYPNEVIVWNGNETVRNFDDCYGREIELLQTLALENMIPEYGILMNVETVEKLGGFDEEYGDFEFYEFVYRNIKSLKLKLAEFAFFENHILDTFIDTSYRSKCVRDVLRKYDWKKEIFYRLSWDKNEQLALSTANTIAGDRLFSYFDFLNASEFYRRAVSSFDNTVSLGKLFDTYFLMGQFKEAEEVLSAGFGIEEKDKRKENLENVRRIIENLEAEVERGNVEGVLRIAPQVYEYYRGAPLNNILGVINFIMKDFENAYRFFYKAVTMNPIKEDYLFNLAEIAKALGKQEEVKGLINRLVKG